MMLRLRKFLLILLLVSCSAASWAQRQWFIPEVAKQIGIVMPFPSYTPNNSVETHDVGRSKISFILLAYFDTTASVVEGRIVDLATQKPVKGAVIQATYSDSCSGTACEKTQLAATNEDGMFLLGWVGCVAPEGTVYFNRPLKVEAVGYESISTREVAFGAAAYLFVEMAAAGKK